MTLSAAKQTKVIGPAAAIKGPGPAGYALPSALGNGTDRRLKSSPSFSFGLNSSPKPKETSPGPVYRIEGSFTRCGRGTTPAYSLSSRPSPYKAQRSPAPCDYMKIEVDKTSIVKKAPAFSMSGRPRTPRDSMVPAPGSYALPPLVSTAPISNKRSTPSFSMSGRLKTGNFQQDKAKTPPPGTYDIKTYDSRKRRAPTLVMTSRPKHKNNSLSPGPGTYEVKARSKVKGGTLGVRYSEYIYLPHAK